MKKNKTLTKTFDPQKLYFVPLGGAEQFGVNFNLYTTGGRWIAVDLGMGFADERFPGVDIMLPDPSFLEERLDSLDALIITHAHEDHIGAVPRLWPRLKCPIYCGAFTAAVLRQKFQEFPECKKAKINVVGPNEMVDLGPFSVKFLSVTHSIPEASSLLIETPLGKILHSGDWNLDAQPVIGHPVDKKLFQSIGEQGVLAYIGDSTNAPSQGRSASESAVAAGLEAVFRECAGRIVVTIFASNVGRLRSIVKAAKACNRQVALIGRSLHNMANAAHTCGYMKDMPPFLTEDDVEEMQDKSIVMIVTGSQGEPRAALSRMARGEHQNVALKRGDTVIFSARAIPGNEKDIDVVKNNLSAAGVKIIGESDTPHLIHASGHPRRDEIIDMLSWIKPQIVVPVHGERLQLEAHAQLARDMGVQEIVVPINGAVICLAPGKPKIEDHVQTGLLAVEANRIIKSDHEAISARRKLQFSGTVHVSLVMDDRGDLLADPKITTIGLIDPNNEQEKKMESNLAQEVEDILADMEREDMYEDHMVHEEIRIGVRRFVQHVLGIKPNTTVHVVRLED